MFNYPLKTKKNKKLFLLTFINNDFNKKEPLNHCFSPTPPNKKNTIIP